MSVFSVLFLHIAAKMLFSIIESLNGTSNIHWLGNAFQHTMSVAAVMVIIPGFRMIGLETPFGSTMVCENQSSSTNLMVLEALNETALTTPTSCPLGKSVCLFTVICFGLEPTNLGVLTT